MYQWLRGGLLASRVGGLNSVTALYNIFAQYIGAACCINNWSFHEPTKTLASDKNVLHLWATAENCSEMFRVRMCGTK